MSQLEDYLMSLSQEEKLLMLTEAESFRDKGVLPTYALIRSISESVFGGDNAMQLDRVCHEVYRLWALQAISKSSQQDEEQE